MFVLLCFALPYRALLSHRAVVLFVSALATMAAALASAVCRCAICFGSYRGGRHRCRATHSLTHANSFLNPR